MLTSFSLKEAESVLLLLAMKLVVRQSICAAMCMTVHCNLSYLHNNQNNYLIKAGRS